MPLKNKNLFYKINHYYVYRCINDVYIYERTCGTPHAAQDRVEELNRRGEAAFYTDNRRIDAYY